MTNQEIANELKEINKPTLVGILSNGKRQYGVNEKLDKLIEKLEK